MQMVATGSSSAKPAGRRLARNSILECLLSRRLIGAIYPLPTMATGSFLNSGNMRSIPAWCHRQLDENVFQKQQVETLI